MDSDVAARARAWRRSWHAAICDVLVPWAHGTVLREDDPGMTVDELIAFSDEALAGLPHGRIDFELIGAAEPLRAEFQARGWKALRLLWMRHEAPPPPGPQVAVEPVPDDAVSSGPHGRRWSSRACLERRYRTPTRSTTNTSVSSGPMTPPAPRLP